MEEEGQSDTLLCEVIDHHDDIDNHNEQHHGRQCCHHFNDHLKRPPWRPSRIAPPRSTRSARFRAAMTATSTYTSTIASWGCSSWPRDVKIARLLWCRRWRMEIKTFWGVPWWGQGGCGERRWRRRVADPALARGFGEGGQSRCRRRRREFVSETVACRADRVVEVTESRFEGQSHPDERRALCDIFWVSSAWSLGGRASPSFLERYHPVQSWHILKVWSKLSSGGNKTCSVSLALDRFDMCGAWCGNRCVLLLLSIVHVSRRACVSESVCLHNTPFRSNLNQIYTYIYLTLL